MSMNDNSSLYAMGFVAAFALVMATPAIAQNVISHTQTTTTTKQQPIVTQVTTPTATGTKTTTTTLTPTTTTTTWSLAANDRTALSSYLTSLYPTPCPAGTLPADEGCLVPGEAGSKIVTSKTYVVGQPLPTTVTLLPLPETVVTTLAPLPTGYSYGRVDGNVFVINDSDRRVIDTVTLYEVD